MKTSPWKRGIVAILFLAMAFAGCAQKSPVDPDPPAATPEKIPDLQATSTTGVITYEFVTLTTSRKVVLGSPNSITGTDAAYFNDTQAGSCWQSYGALGTAIPPHTTCTIQISFLPDDSKTTFNATLTVSRCTHYTIDPTFGFVVCTDFDGSQSVSLVGTRT